MRPPSARLIELDELCQPYRALLANDASMTLRLERFFGGRLVLRPLSTLTEAGWYYRRVLLVQDCSGRAAELGAICIQLQRFGESIREQIHAGVIPLGPLLLSNGIEFESRPKFFLSVTPNAEMMGIFSLAEPRDLYGRRSELFEGRVKIGDVIEILPHLGERDNREGVPSNETA
jgi:chorismate-pyruvate lyase